MLTRLTLLSGFLLVGCTSVDSDNVFTSGIYARVSATADGAGDTQVRTTLYLESPSSLNYIELEGDDILTAYGPMGVEKIMRESQFLGITSYSATFETEDANSEFIVGLSRIIDDSAPDSRVTLPAPFDIDTAEGDTYSRATDDVQIGWLAGIDGDDMDFSVRGTCFETVNGSMEGDPGVLTIFGNEIILVDGEGVDDTCLATITVTRSRPGLIDPNYGYGGDAYGYQTRDFSFTTAP